MTIPKKGMPVFSFNEPNQYLYISPPKEFSYSETLHYLSRSPLECMHYVEDRNVYKLLDIDGVPSLIIISQSADSLLQIRFADRFPRSQSIYEQVYQYIVEWFDLKIDLTTFYSIAKNDPLLSTLATDYYGLRIIGIPDMFEALCWAVIGQQVNLQFAYSIKKRFVESFGKRYVWNERDFWIFPKAQDIAKLSIAQCKNLQLTEKKAEYIIGIAQLMEKGILSKDILNDISDFKQAEQQLTSIRGIGPWTANYVLMRCLRDPSAFPIGDVALHNALKQQLNRVMKPTIAEIQEIFSRFKNWEAYVVFYLWRSLK